MRGLRYASLRDLRCSGGSETRREPTPDKAGWALHGGSTATSLSPTVPIAPLAKPRLRGSLRARIVPRVLGRREASRLTAFPRATPLGVQSTPEQRGVVMTCLGPSAAWRAHPALSGARPKSYRDVFTACPKQVMTATHCGPSGGTHIRQGQSSTCGCGRGACRNWRTLWSCTAHAAATASGCAAAGRPRCGAAPGRAATPAVGRESARRYRPAASPIAAALVCGRQNGKGRGARRSR